MKNTYLHCIICCVLFNGCIFYKEVKIKDVESIKIGSISLKKADLKVALRLINPNFYKITVLSGDIDIAIEDEKIGTLKIDNSIVLLPGTESSQTLPIEVVIKDVFSRAKSILALLTLQKVKLTLKGEIVVKALLVNKHVKIEYQNDVSLLQ